MGVKCLPRANNRVTCMDRVDPSEPDGICRVGLWSFYLTLQFQILLFECQILLDRFCWGFTYNTWGVLQRGHPCHRHMLADTCAGHFFCLPEQGRFQSQWGLFDILVLKPAGVSNPAWQVCWGFTYCTCCTLQSVPIASCVSSVRLLENPVLFYQTSLSGFIWSTVTSRNWILVLDGERH